MIKELFSQALIAVAMSVLAIAGYHVWTVRHAPPPLRFATVDVLKVYNTKFQQAAKEIKQAGASEVDKERIIKEGDRFAQEFGKLLAELPGQCQCIVLSKESIVGGVEVWDLTAYVMRQLKMVS